MGGTQSMFWMTALLGMVAMGSLDFFSAKPIGEPDIKDDRDMRIQKINGIRPYWTMAPHI